ncbi:MAG: alpha/beta hydrolase [Alphaproteobacteria bacterium]|nr:alpha/beta hydrolase [Alphaproteobacteria bacterium]
MKIETTALDDFPLTIAYACWPAQGEEKGTVVAVPGLSRQKKDFDFIAAYLSSHGYTVLAVDPPGRGESTWCKNPDDYCYDAYVPIFVSFLKQTCPPHVHWIGTSMGGLLAMAMVEKGHKNIFRSLTLVDITHRPNYPVCREISENLSFDIPVRQSIEEQVKIIKEGGLPLGNVPDHVWHHYAEHQLRKTDKGYVPHFDPKILIRAKADLAVRIDYTKGLKHLSCPISLVAGGKSTLCTAEEIADFQTLKPNAGVLICPDAGHIPALSDETSQNFIKDFLDSASSG